MLKKRAKVPAPKPKAWQQGQDDFCGGRNTVADGGVWGNAPLLHPRMATDTSLDIQLSSAGFLSFGSTVESWMEQASLKHENGIGAEIKKVFPHVDIHMIIDCSMMPHYKKEETPPGEPESGSHRHGNYSV